MCLLLRNIQVGPPLPIIHCYELGQFCFRQRRWGKKFWSQCLTEQYSESMFLPSKFSFYDENSLLIFLGTLYRVSHCKLCNFDYLLKGQNVKYTTFYFSWLISTIGNFIQFATDDLVFQCTSHEAIILKKKIVFIFTETSVNLSQFLLPQNRAYKIGRTK